MACRCVGTGSDLTDDTDLKDYQQYRSILIQLQKFYGLDSFNLKEIDKYLWQAGKEYFKRY